MRARAATYSARSVTYQVSRTRCSGRPPAAPNTATTLASARAACSPRSSESNACATGSHPICPAIASTRPCASTPSAYPAPRGQPSGRISSTRSPHLAQPVALQLPRRRARQLAHELHAARVLVGRDLALDELLEPLRRRVVRRDAGFEDDERLHDLPALLVGHPDDATLLHVGVQQDRALHLRAGDVVPRRDDHVVRA